MNRLRRFFDHLHAHEEILEIRLMLLFSLAVSITLVAISAPLSITFVLFTLLFLSFACNSLKLSLPFYITYPIGFLLLWTLRLFIPNGIFGAAFIPSFFTLLALAQSFKLQRYWHAEVLLILLLGCNASALLLNSSATFSVWSTILMVLNIGQLLRLHIRNFSLTTLLTSMRSALRTSLYTLPTVLIFIYVFQKSYINRNLNFNSTYSGISSILEPGRISQVTKRSGLAYRVYLSRPLPPFVEAYWKVLNLERSEGLKWTVLPAHEFTRKAFYPNKSCLLEQVIYGQNNERKQDQVFLDKLVLGTYAKGNPTVAKSYVCSDDTLEPVVKELSANKILDFEPSAQLIKLAQSFKDKTADRVADNIVSFYRKNKFNYSLTPAPLNKQNSIEDFLFHTREGFCEHFAGTAATLLRLAHVPARVVAGYQGGAYNSFGDYWMVSYSDAHAWVEYWNGHSWQRFDPTALVFPDALSKNHQSVFFTSFTEAIDSFVFKFETFFSGRDRLFNLSELTLDPVLALGSLVLLLLTFHIRRRLLSLDTQIKVEFQNFCRSFEAWGLMRTRTEGYEHFRLRIFAALAQNRKITLLEHDINTVFENYQKFRFGSQIHSSAQLKNLLKDLKILKRKLVKRRFE